MKIRVLDAMLLCGVSMNLGIAQTASAQEFYQANVLLDLVKEESTPTVFAPEKNGTREQLEILPDNVFARMDMRVIVDAETAPLVKKMVDQGFTDEPAGCLPGVYGPLDTDTGLRYFLDVLDRNPRKLQFTFYPGEKATNWANSAYCEFDPELGEDFAVVRFTGFFHVRHRKLTKGQDIIFSAIPVSPEQVSKNRE